MQGDITLVDPKWSKEKWIYELTNLGLNVDENPDGTLHVHYRGFIDLGTAHPSEMYIKVPTALIQ